MRFRKGDFGGEEFYTGVVEDNEEKIDFTATRLERLREDRLNLPGRPWKANLIQNFELVYFVKFTIYSATAGVLTTSVD